jgi:hypothetical protein
MLAGIRSWPRHLVHQLRHYRQHCLRQVHLSFGAESPAKVRGLARGIAVLHGTYLRRLWPPRHCLRVAEPFPRMAVREARAEILTPCRPLERTICRLLSSRAVDPARRRRDPIGQRSGAVGRNSPTKGPMGAR